MSFLVNDVFPAGIVLPYAGAAAPDGWLLCNGQAVSQTQYKRLFDAIGPAFNNGSEPPGQFRLPDTRGVFLRGAGSQTIGAETYSATLGTKQNDATAVNGLANTTSTTTSGAHEHVLTVNDNSGNYPLYGGTGGSGAGYLGRPSTEFPNSFSTGNAARIAKAAQNTTTDPNVSLNSAHTHGISVSSTDTETRPANIGINHIIKV